MKHPIIRNGTIFAFLSAAILLLLLAGTVMQTMTASAKTTRDATTASSVQTKLVDSSRPASSLDTGPSNPTAFTITAAHCSQGIGETGSWACQVTVYCYFDYGVPGAPQHVLHNKTYFSYLEDASLTEGQADDVARSRAPHVYCAPTQIRYPHYPGGR